MKFVERPLIFEYSGERLVGVLAEPERPARVAVLVIVGGPQYRVGSHRQFVLLARRLAAGGFVVLRFDYRGMGDSTGAERTFEECGPDIAASIDAMRASCPGIERVVLWGLCDAASAALDYWHSTSDARIAGLVLLNPWVRSETSLAKVHVKHYYWNRLMGKEFWLKLLGGGVRPVEALRTFARNVRIAAARPPRTTGSAAMAFQDRMAAALRSFPHPVLLILSGDDLTAKEFLEYAQSDEQWRDVLLGGNIERHDLADADHTFSSEHSSAEVESRALRWLSTAVFIESR
jgi:exosortase A-associated hydrolase 1